MAEITFNESAHEYKIDGAHTPSVTQILSSVGMYKGLENVPKNVLKIAGERGHIIHECIELHLKNELDESSIDPELSGYFNAYLSARKEYPQIFEKLHTYEKMVYSKKYKYCGRLDACGDRLIVDWKTTAQTDPVHGLQLSAYWMAEHPDYLHDKPETLACLYLHKDGDFVFVKYEYQPLAWMACLAVHKWQMRNGKA